MAKNRAPQEAEASVETGLEAVQEKSAPISFEEPVSAADLTAAVADNPQDQLLSEAQMAQLHAEANRDDTKRDFTLKVLAARAKTQEEPAPPPPLAPRIADQTNAEIEAGRKMNAHHAALQVHRPKPVVNEHGAKSEAVFRPGDYVPDQKKGQGYTSGRNL